MPEPVTRPGGSAAIRAALLAGAAAGVGLWCTLGALERVFDGSRVVRVALLPSPASAALWVGVGAAVAVALAMSVARRAGGTFMPAAADAEVTRPLYAGLALTLPYLPFLPDWWPALTVLAGPFAIVVWSGIAVLTARAALERLAAAGRGISVSVRRAPLAVGLASVLLYGTAALRLVGTSLYPGGDEPHYLVVAQSLWRDGDLRIENNHARGDTFEYFARPLAPHYLVRGIDREIYSIHPVGLPVLVAPIYAAGGYYGVASFVVFCAVLAGVRLWTLARRLTSAHAATIAWLAAGASVPFVFNSFTVYPEVPAALAAIAAYGLMLRPNGLVAHAGAAVGCGALLGALPWLSSKYALMVAVLGLAAAARVWWSDLPATLARRLRVLVLLTLPVVGSVAGWMTFHARIWGSPLPSVVYGQQRPMRWEYLVSGGPGLLFDQEYGIVAAAPVLLLAAVGLWQMIRVGGTARRVAVEVTLVVIALLLAVGAFHIWWGGSASVGRPMIAALLFLGLPIAWVYERSGSRPAVRAVCWMLVACGLATVGVLAFSHQGLLLVGDRSGISRVLAHWSPAWPLTQLAPSFIARSPLQAGAVAVVWVGALLGGLVVLARATATSPGRTGLRTFMMAAVSLAAVAALVPWLPGYETPRGPELRERPHSTLLEGFDAGVLPLGVIYRPLRLVEAAAIPPLVTFAAGPQPRPGRTIPPLFLNARWALPAGEYRLELQATGGARLEGAVALQVGRAGEPILHWTLDGSTKWATRFALPVDARFVGLVASPALTDVRVGLQPIAIADASARRPELDVVSARIYGPASVFFYDERTWPEPGGFWIRGDDEARFAVVASPDRRVALRVRAGAAPVSLRLRTGSSTHHLQLAAGATQDVALGPPARAVTQIEVATAGGFVPATVDPASTDTRLLGCWVEIAG